MADIASELREFFELEKREYKQMERKPDEFTLAMFCERTGIARYKAEGILSARIKSGELVRRGGRDDQGKNAFLYKIVKKK